MNVIFQTNAQYPFCAVSSNGEVTTISTKDKEVKKLRKTFKNKHEYDRLQVKGTDNKQHNELVSRLTFFTFFDGQNSGKEYEVHHRNWDRADNRLTNLSLIERKLHRGLKHPRSFSLEEINIDFDKVDIAGLSGMISLDEFLGCIHFICEKDKSEDSEKPSGRVYLMEELCLDFNEIDTSNLSGLVAITTLEEHLYYHDKKLEQIANDAYLTADKIPQETYLVEVV